jgi:hypothetical protein
VNLCTQSAREISSGNSLAKGKVGLCGGGESLLSSARARLGFALEQPAEVDTLVERSLGFLHI